MCEVVMKVATEVREPFKVGAAKKGAFRQALWFASEIWWVADNQVETLACHRSEAIAFPDLDDPLCAIACHVRQGTAGPLLG